jgi:hypothetical protein
MTGAPSFVIVTVYAFGQPESSTDSPCWHDAHAA